MWSDRTGAEYVDVLRTGLDERPAQVGLT